MVYNMLVVSFFFTYVCLLYLKKSLLAAKIHFFGELS